MTTVLDVMCQYEWLCGNLGKFKTYMIGSGVDPNTVGNVFVQMRTLCAKDDIDCAALCGENPNAAPAASGENNGLSV